MQIPTTNNEGFQTTIAKNASLNDDATYTSDNSKHFNPVIFTKRLRSCKSKRINEEKDDNEFFGLITLTKYLRSRGNRQMAKTIKIVTQEAKQRPLYMPSLPNV